VVVCVVSGSAKRGSPRLESLIEQQPRTGKLCAVAELPLAGRQLMEESVSLHFR
jgi:hypothetical protein